MTTVSVTDPNQCVAIRGKSAQEIRIQRETESVREVRIRQKDGTPIDFGTATAMRLEVSSTLDAPGSSAIDKDILPDQVVGDLNIGKIAVILSAVETDIERTRPGLSYRWQITITDGGALQRYPFSAGSFVVEGIVEP